MDFNTHLFSENAVMTAVIRVSGISDYQRLLPGLLKQAAGRHNNLCYIHFAAQSLLGENRSGLKVMDVSLSHRFEAFTMDVYNSILTQPENSFFLFDSLSELQTAWATDWMMENFFRVISPVIRKRNGRAFFPLIRSMHSEIACREILQDTDVFMDLYADINHLYARIEKTSAAAPYDMPLSVDAANGSFSPITDSAETARFLRAVSLDSRNSERTNRDAWERFFDKTQQEYAEGKSVDKACARMANIMMSRDDRIRALLRRHFTPIDYFQVREHMVGTGLIGGKACGMLIARKIVENLRPDTYSRFEAHDSFFIGSDVFYSYIVDNHFWDLRVRQRTEEGYFAVADEFADKLRNGVFSEKLENEFRRVLDYYGSCPIIVRSSSILEDGFGNAFAGKYDSVFCTCAGTPEERLKEFEDAIRIVYASTLSRSALDYRLRRGLNNRDEQMSLLVMRVSGSFYGDYYFPCAAGVGYSYSTYRFLEDLDPNAGMLRLVMGLGTSAVDRIKGSYPRLVSLKSPEATPYRTPAEHHRYSQRAVEVVNTKTRILERIDPQLLKPLLSFAKRNLLFQHDREAEMRFSERGQSRDISFVSCPGIVKNRQLMDDMHDLMKAIESEYDQAVDIEFTINPDADGTCLINLLQCRPLQAFRDTGNQSIPSDLADDDLLLDCSHSSMGLSQAADIDWIVTVDPIAYYNMPYKEKQNVALSIGRFNWKMRGLDQKLLLFTPGRLGTSSPELGVPVTFADISEFRAVFEISESRAGYNPELSYGSHMFQDLVENEILYGAVFENEKRRIFTPGKFEALPNLLAEEDPQGAYLSDVIRICCVKESGCRLYHDMLHERLVITLPEGGKKNE